jgi:hypothetical protein
MSDAEFRGVQARNGSHHSRELYVADFGVARILPVNPVLLNQFCLVLMSAFEGEHPMKMAIT